MIYLLHAKLSKQCLLLLLLLLFLLGFILSTVAKKFLTFIVFIKEDICFDLQGSSRWVFFPGHEILKILQKGA